MLAGWNLIVAQPIMFKSLSCAKEDRQLKNYFMERERGAAGTLFRVDWNN